jgi:NADH dehydrogenase FAD-containing subunit/uncharacterized membrane protein YphA (DoxX/SURF4 family)
MTTWHEAATSAGPTGEAAPHRIKGHHVRLATLIHRLRRTAEDGLGSALDLIARLWIAQGFFVSGVLKASDWKTALALSANEYPVPWLDPVAAAWLGVAVELIGSILLSFGLLTRFAATALAALCLVIYTHYQALPDTLLTAILLGWFVVRGAGRHSLDRLFGPAVAESAVPGGALLAKLFDATTRRVGPVFQLFVRLWMAEIFWSSGLSKIASWPTTVLLFAEEYRVPVLPPEWAAALATSIELTMPVLLAVGLLTRASTLPLLAMTLVIQLTYLDRAEHVLWMLLLGQVLLRGAGPLSLDHLLWRRLTKVLPQLDGIPFLPGRDAPHVVIVGAGFGGLAAARALAHTAAQVTVIDRRNYHLFQPLLYQVATAGISPADIATPIRSILRDQANTRVLLGRVTGIDQAGRAVLIGETRVPYDYLVLATGARHSYFGREDWAADAPGLKKVDDALAIRHRILSAFEAAEATTDEAERRHLLTFVVVGAGPTGVELAGAIVELARVGMAKEFRSFDPASARVILVEAGPRVLAAFPDSLSGEARTALTRLGVEVRTGQPVKEIAADHVVLGDERLETRTVIWAAGVTASPAAKWLGVEADRAGRVKVGPDLSVPGKPDIFVIGDTAAVTDAFGQAVPGLAPAAKQEGTYVARLIGRRIEGRGDQAAFRYLHVGSLATIGRKAAVADFGFVRLTGALAWWFWGMVHVAFLVGARNRLAVLLDWMWSYLTFGRGVRLITGGRD